jgi:BirA family biotin operon repressor/biotin-[acetyl-CoA-carboxylase] ligase
MAKLHAGLVDQGICFLALQQTAGKGQRGKQWLSAPGENITMSTVFEPSRSLSPKIAAFPFLFSATIALGCYDFTKDYGFSNVAIKWPNDVYINDRKAAGILIENVKQGSSWRWAVAGTGININQQQFSAESGKPVSFSMISGRQYNVVELGRHLHQNLLKRYFQLATADPTQIMERYNQVLYKKGDQVRLKKGIANFTATISHVNQTGELVTTGAMEQQFASGEVEFI